MREDSPLAARTPTLPAGGGPPIIWQIRTFADELGGDLLLSHDGKAMLVSIELTTDFLKKRNASTIRKFEQLVQQLEAEGRVPKGLAISFSGSAVLGRDFALNSRKSADSTELWTIIMVVGLLILVYRSPLLAIVPLVTVFLAVDIALSLLALLAGQGVLGVFDGLEAYITVIAYGAGVDFTLFLTARYQEEVEGGAANSAGIAQTIERVGAAVAASAGTQIGGLAMMSFAEFGKFREAGIGISGALCLVLLASLTFSMSLLRGMGRWALPRQNSALPAGRWMRLRRVQETLEQWRPRPLRNLWDRVAGVLLQRPGAIWLGAVGIMVPCALLAVVMRNDLCYGMLNELPPDAPSVVGTHDLQRHFPAGFAGPVTLLVHSDTVDFRTPAGVQAVAALTKSLGEHHSSFEIADIFSVAEPLGIGKPEAAPLQVPLGLQIVHLLFRNAQWRIMQSLAADYYVSSTPESKGHVTRLHFISERDPFTRDRIRRFGELRQVVADALPPELQQNSRLDFVGATASLYDLKSVASRDRVNVNALVVLGVFTILVILLRNVAHSLYLILTVLLSYFTTLGLTFAVFRIWEGEAFQGLNWTVPMFLFTVLVAVGADYNIFLVTRIEEEQQRHGPVRGIQVALVRTGRIISSCGVIMAGTFASLVIGGTLTGMVQLGTALCCGVLLDTFVVRPVLVPAYLLLLQSGRFGRWGKYLGSLGPAASGPGGSASPPAAPGQPPAGSAIPHSIRR